MVEFKKNRTRLMTEIIVYAENMNLRNIELKVLVDNVVAIALYHKMGFSGIGIYKISSLSIMSTAMLLSCRKV